MPTTNAKVRRTYLGRVDGDPPEGDLEGGELWFDTDAGAYRGYDGTDYVTVDVTPDD